MVFFQNRQLKVQILDQGWLRMVFWGIFFACLLLASTTPNGEDTVKPPNAGTRVIRMATPGELHLAVEMLDPTLVAEGSWRKTRPVKCRANVPKS